MSIFKISGRQVPVEEWYGRVEKRAEENGDLPLLDRIISHVRDHCIWLKGERERKNHALECLVSGAWRAWEDRGEFSRIGREDEPVEFTFYDLLREVGRE